MKSLSEIEFFLSSWRDLIANDRAKKYDKKTQIQFIELSKSFEISTAAFQNDGKVERLVLYSILNPVFPAISFFFSLLQSFYFFLLKAKRIVDSPFLEVVHEIETISIRYFTICLLFYVPLSYFLLQNRKKRNIFNAEIRSYATGFILKTIFFPLLIVLLKFCVRPSFIHQNNANSEQKRERECVVKKFCE